MKKIKIYNIRERKNNKIHLKIGILTTLFLLIFSVLNLFNNSTLLTDILQNNKITKNILQEKVKKLDFNGTVWPVKEITDLNYKHLSQVGLTYEDVRKMLWSKVPNRLKKSFPIKWKEYIKKYKNITLQTCWNVFTDPDDLADFTFRRRIIRATWTASYKSKEIWKKNMGTHAGIDIIGNKGTPIYSIANGVVVQLKTSDKGFGKLVSVLYKKNKRYFLGFYGHLNSIYPTLKVGNLVKKGEKIGTLGDTGNSSGYHLHFQLNKVEKIKDIFNGKATKGLFPNSELVNKYTIDPIVFIESNLTINKFKGIGDIDIKKQNISIDAKLVKKLINTNKHTMVSKIIESSYVKEAKINLISNKIQLGYSFNITLKVQPGNGKITILSSNENLLLGKDKIINPDKKEYNINIIARKIGRTRIKILDGKTERVYDIIVYGKDDKKVFGIGVKINKHLNLLSDTKIELYPINKLGQRIGTKLKGDFTIYTLINGKKEFIKNIKLDDKKYIYLKGKTIGKGKLIIQNERFYSKVNLVVDISKDFSYNQQFAKNMNLLIKYGILKGANGYLLPNRNLTRRELVVILGRSVLKTDYKKARIEMLNYIKSKGRFFNDIKGDLYADPYLYDARKKGIIKGEKGYSLSSNYISKAELLTIFIRVFKIKTYEDKLIVWQDLKIKKLKKIADTVRKYNLYPLKNYKIFNAGSYVTRLNVFESLKRFIDFAEDDKNIILVHTSASNKIDKKGDDLENVMGDIFDF